MRRSSTGQRRSSIWERCSSVGKWRSSIGERCSSVGKLHSSIPRGHSSVHRGGVAKALLQLGTEVASLRIDVVQSRRGVVVSPTSPMLEYLVSEIPFFPLCSYTTSSGHGRLSKKPGSLE